MRITPDMLASALRLARRFMTVLRQRSHLERDDRAIHVYASNPSLAPPSDVGLARFPYCRWRD
jgi:hypothetical protein